VSDSFPPNREDEPERETDPRAGSAAGEDTVLLTYAEASELLEQAAENVLEGWPEPLAGRLESREGPRDEEDPAHGVPEPIHARHDDVHPAAAPPAAPAAEEVEPDAASAEHAPGDLTVPPGYAVLEGFARGERRAVGVVVARFNGDVTSRLLQSALDELELRGVSRDAITVMPVPGAFELPLAAMALAKTRRFACVVALGCVIRGDTPHFDYVATEAASGLQLAAIETGVPVAFGVLTLERVEQAEPRIQKGAEAVQTALEMADVFANLRAAAAR
jgi:6,7-dimethyl-8-ribityllumazine synthase